MKLTSFLLATCCVASCALFDLSTAHEVSSHCLECLCQGSTKNCDRSAGCDNYGFCGPFRMTRGYWEEAGSFGNDFQTCAMDYACAERTVKAYMEKFGKDCDGDGDVDCQDYALIHHKGRQGCPYRDFASDSLYRFVTDCMKRHQQLPTTTSSAGDTWVNQQQQQQQQQQQPPQQQQFFEQRPKQPKESLPSAVPLDNIGQDQQTLHRNIRSAQDDRSRWDVRGRADDRGRWEDRGRWDDRGRWGDSGRSDDRGRWDDRSRPAVGRGGEKFADKLYEIKEDVKDLLGFPSRDGGRGGSREGNRKVPDFQDAFAPGQQQQRPLQEKFQDAKESIKEKFPLSKDSSQDGARNIQDRFMPKQQQQYQPTQQQYERGQDQDGYRDDQRQDSRRKFPQQQQQQQPRQYDDTEGQDRQQQSRQDEDSYRMDRPKFPQQQQPHHQYDDGYRQDQKQFPLQQTRQQDEDGTYGKDQRPGQQQSGQYEDSSYGPQQRRFPQQSGDDVVDEYVREPKKEQLLVHRHQSAGQYEGDSTYDQTGRRQFPQGRNQQYSLQ